MSTQTTRELKGLVFAVIAGVVAVGLSFGAGAVIRSASASSSQPATSAAKSTTLSASAPSGFSTQMISTGRQLFAPNCASCHGPTGAGAYGPNLHNSNQPDARIAAIIANGKGQMPPFKSQLNSTQINDIVGYIKTLK